MKFPVKRPASGNGSGLWRGESERGKIGMEK
jgi:hypothetical protein